MKNKPKHNWSYEEDKYICDLYRDMFITKTYNYYSFKDILEKVTRKFSYLNPISVDRRIRNIKSICRILKIKDKLNISDLAHYALQTLQAFKDSLQEINFDITKNTEKSSDDYIFEEDYKREHPFGEDKIKKELIKKDTIDISSIVTIQYLDDNEILTITGNKNNVSDNIKLVDTNSPLMQGLLNKKVKDIITINPAPKLLIKIKILKIENN